MPIAQIDLASHSSVEVLSSNPRPRADRGIVWLDIEAPTEQDLSWLEATYRFHPLAIEDCRHFNQRAKVEAYDGYLFLSLTTSTRSNGEVQAHELQAFLGHDYLITVHSEPLPAIEKACEKVTPALHPDFLLYLIADQMTDVYFPLLDEVEDEIDDLEDQILENATQQTLQRVFHLKQQLVFLRKTAAPMRDLMNSLAGTRYGGLIEEHTALYFRDLYDHLTRIYDLVETSRDLLGNALDAYLSSVSNRLNEVMKRLTLIATIFMPISFVVGLGGINFQQMPFNDPSAFVIFMSVVVLVPIAMLVWFRRSRWV